MKNILLIFIMLFCFSLISKAQNPAPPASFEIFTTVLNQSSQLSVADLLAGTTSINNDSADYTLKVVLTVLDTVNISNIHLSIGNTAGDSSLYNSVIPFTNLNTSTEYREGNIIYIQTDTLFNLGNIFGDVHLEDQNGSISTTVNFQSN